MYESSNYNSTYYPGWLLSPFFIGFALVIAIFYIFCMWKIFTKAGEEGWKCIIPIYNIIVLLKIIGKPWWWLFLFIIPLVNYVFIIWMYNMLSKSFGKDEGFTVGLVLLGFIFFPVLALGSARYLGPYGDRDRFSEHQQRGQFDFDHNRLAS